MKSCWWVIIASLLVFADCSQIVWQAPKLNGSMTAPVTQYVCIDVPPAQELGVKLAVVAWDRSLSQWKRLVPITDNDAGAKCDYVIHETTEVNADDEKALAWASMVGGHLIFLTKGRYESDPTGIVLHELGHAFGAQHVGGTLMNSTHEKGWICPDVVTVAQVAAWNHVNLALLGWCSR